MSRAILSQPSAFGISEAQKRILDVENLFPNAALNVIGGVGVYQEVCDIPAMELAINQLLLQHASLRIQYDETHQKQYIEPWQEKKFAILSFDDEMDLNSWMQKEAGCTMHFHNQPLYRFKLFKVSERHCGYLVQLHHFIADGWSFKLLCEFVAKAFQLASTNLSTLTRVACDYQAIALQEQRYLSSSRFKKDAAYWHDKFQTLPNMSPYPVSKDVVGQRYKRVLSKAESAQITRLTDQVGLSGGALTVGLSAILVHLAYGLNDVTIGVPVYNRTSKQAKQAIGMFTSTMPFRLVMEVEQSVTQILQIVGRNIKKDFRHQKYPFNYLEKELRQRHGSTKKLFHLSSNFYNTQNADKSGATKIINHELYATEQLHDLHFILKPHNSPNKLELNVDYKTDCYSEDQAKWLADTFISLVDYILNHDQASLADCRRATRGCFLADAVNLQGRKLDIGTVPSLFTTIAKHVQSQPQRPALRYQQEQLSYRQLALGILQFEAFLLENKVDSNQLVLLIVPPGLQLVVSFWSLLRVGITVCPIDPETPVKRLQQIQKQSNAKAAFVIGTDWPKLDCAIYDIEHITNVRSSELSPRNLADRLSTINYNQEDIAYVLFTSGSTGTPKGVQVTHGALLNYCYWACNEYLHANDIVGLYSSPAFDLTITSIFPPLMAGACIHCYAPDESDTHVLLDIVRHDKCTFLKMTPAHLGLLQNHDLENSRLRTLIVGGEALTVKLANTICRQFNKPIRIVNEYGPTEATVGCIVYDFTAHKCQDEKSKNKDVAIGLPITNTGVVLLDEHNRQVKLGETGEIYLMGKSLASGYLNDVQRTQDAFLANAFAPNSQIMYRTGDLAFYDGKLLHYVGRRDSQIKLRGFRIEINEIEGRLLLHPKVKEVKVLLRELPRPQLCAWIVTESHKERINWHEYLTQYIPTYMVPAYFTLVKSLPLTANGKIDPDNLPAPIIPHCEQHSPSQSPELKLLLTFIEPLLELSNSEYNRSFAELGGDSIKAIELSAALLKEGYCLPSNKILHANSLIELSMQLKRHSSKQIYNQAPVSGMFFATPAQSWFINNRLPVWQHYNQYVVLAVDLEYATQLPEALAKLVKLHDAFRINWDPEAGELVFNPKLLSLTWKPLNESADVSETAPSPSVLASALQQQSTAINPLSGWLIAASWVARDYEQAWMLVSTHHLAVDGISWRILLQQIEQLLSSEETVIPQKTLSSHAFVQKLAKEQCFDKQIDYWQALNDLPALPKEDDVEITEYAKRALSTEQSESLVDVANKRYNTTPQELLVCSLALALQQILSLKRFVGDQLVIELEHHGRNESGTDLIATLGWFTAIAPFALRTTLTSLGELIKSTKDELRRIPNDGIGYGVLLFLQKKLKPPQTQRIRFNYLGEFADNSTNSLLRISDFGLSQSVDNPLTSPLELNIAFLNGQLYMEFHAQRCFLDHMQLQDFADSYVDALTQIMSHCLSHEEREFTVSDFASAQLDNDDLLELLG